MIKSVILILTSNMFLSATEPNPRRSTIPERPEPHVRVIHMRVTACSPEDRIDVGYYNKNGYEGGVYGIAAYTKVFPRGTMMRIPGYLEQSQPGKYWPVDSAGGSVIRRSAREGITHIDVKFRTERTALLWGSRYLDVEVIDANDYREWCSNVAQWEARYGATAQSR